MYFSKCISRKCMFEQQFQSTGASATWQEIASLSHSSRHGKAANQFQKIYLPKLQSVFLSTANCICLFLSAVLHTLQRHMPIWESKKTCKSKFDVFPCKVSCGIFHLLWPGLFYFASSCKWKLVFHHEMWLGSVSLSKIWVGSESAGKYLEAKWKTVCLRLQALSGVLLCLFKKIQNFASNF